MINSLILELIDISCEHDFSISELHTLNPALKEFGLQRQSPNAFDLAITAGVIKSGCARTVGSQRPEDYLIQEFRMSKSVARKHINVAEELEKSEEAEKTAFKALRRGYLNVESLDRIIQECNELAPEAAASKFEILQSACKQSGMLGSTGAVREVRRLVRKANSRFPTNPDIAFQKRKLIIGKQDSNGGARITGYLDAATLALLNACITSFIRKKTDANPVNPNNSNAGTEATQSVEKNFQKCSVDAVREALKANAHQAEHVGSTAACTVVAIVTSDDLRSIASSAASSAAKLGLTAENMDAVLPTESVTPADETQEIHPTRLRFPTTSGLDLGITDLLRLRLTPDVYGAFYAPETPLTEQSLRLGRSRRSASFAQRLALALFDRCCQYPGCEMPMSKCDVHHIEAWSRGGATDIENLTLMCRYHHSLNDDSQSNPECGHMSERLPENMWKSGWIAPTTKTGVSNKDGAECPSTEFNHSFAATNAPVATLSRTETLPR